MEALTGVNPDRLPEEKRRGMTIDLGFAELTLPAPDNTCLGIIDVPGHEDFINNMVAGVGSVDLALLAVAADDGWMPQTEEHMQILGYLGVRHAVIALTKADLVSGLADNILSIRAHLREGPFADAPIVATSISWPQSLAALREQLARTCREIPPPRDRGKPRLAVDRAFTLRGVGTVVTGTLAGGSLQRGEAVVIQPAGMLARIRTIESHGRDIAQAGPGRRVALNLADVSVALSRGEKAVRRGDVVTLPGLGMPAPRLDIHLFSGGTGAREQARGDLRSGSRVRVYLGSASVGGRVRLSGTRELQPGASGIARLALDAPLFALAGDRLILRDAACRRTIAGGQILDAIPPIALGKPQRALLRQRASSGCALEAMLRTELERDGALRMRDLLAQSIFSATEVTAAAEHLAANGAVVRRNGLVADSDWWTRAVQRASAAIDDEHRSHPDHFGLDLARLRTALALKVPEFTDAIVEELCRAGFVRVRAQIKRASHRPALPAALQVAGARIRTQLAARGIDPPPRKEVAPDAVSQQALHFLIQTCEAIDLCPDLAMDAAAFQQAQARIAQYLRKHGASTTGELREALSTSRRIIVPLLERCDRDGLTQRTGDKRTWRAPAASVP